VSTLKSSGKERQQRGKTQWENLYLRLSACWGEVPKEVKFDATGAMGGERPGSKVRSQVLEKKCQTFCCTSPTGRVRNKGSFEGKNPKRRWTDAPDEEAILKRRE